MLQDNFSSSYSRRAQVAFLSFRTIPDIAFMAPSSRLAVFNHSFYLHSRTTISPVNWVDMLETNRLPKVTAHMLSGQVQASAVLHCIHFLVVCAVTGCLVRFRPGTDRKKSRPWIWRRRLLVSRHLPPHKRKTGNYHSSYTPLIPFSSALNRLNLITPDPNKLRYMDGALRSLLHLLNRATISPLLIFALRVALSITWTSRVTLDIWPEVRKAMKKHVDHAAAGSTNLRMLGFVDPSNVWRDRPWNRLT